MAKSKLVKSLKLPWCAWNGHVIDSRGRGVAWNVGKDTAKAIVVAVHEKYGGK